jgi:hypothetical protein
VIRAATIKEKRREEVISENQRKPAAHPHF